MWCCARLAVLAFLSAEAADLAAADKHRRSTSKEEFVVTASGDAAALQAAAPHAHAGLGEQQREAEKARIAARDEAARKRAEAAQAQARPLMRSEAALDAEAQRHGGPPRQQQDDGEEPQRGGGEPAEDTSELAEDDEGASPEAPEARSEGPSEDFEQQPARRAAALVRRHVEDAGDEEEAEDNSLAEGEALAEEGEDEAEMPPPVHCQWNSWGSWAKCSVTCGKGSRKRTRGVKVAPKNGGVPCSGSSSATDSCPSNPICTTTTTTTTSTTTTTTTTTKAVVKAGAARGAFALAAVLFALAAPLLH